MAENDKKSRNRPNPQNASNRKGRKAEKPISEDVYPVIDTDLGRDNVENDIPEADLLDL